MSLFSAIKLNSKKALKNNWGRAIGAHLIPGIVLLIVTLMVSVVAGSVFLEMTSSGGFTIYDFDFTTYGGVLAVLSMFKVVLAGEVFLLLTSFFVVVPLNLGLARWHFELAKGTSLPVTSIFYFFEKAGRYMRALGLAVKVGVRQWFWAVIYFVVPSGAVLAGLYIWGNNTQILESSIYRVLFLTGLGLTFIIILAVIFVYLAHMNKYFLAPYLVGIKDSNKAGKSIKYSVNNVKKYRYSLFWFKFSFIGWFVLGAILPPFMLYVVPYYNSALAMFAQFITETIKREQPSLIDSIPDFKQETARPEIQELPEEAERNPGWGVEDRENNPKQDMDIQI